MKSNFAIKIGFLFLVFTHFFCTEPTVKSKPTAIASSKKTEIPHSANFATAQIALNIETLSGNILAYVNLDLYAPNDSGKYKVKTLLIDNGENGPFNNLVIADKAIITKNAEIKVWLTYELQAQRLNWETVQGKLTGVYGDLPFKQSLKSAGGSLTGTATLVFDEKSMNLTAQNSMVNKKVTADFNKNDSNYVQWDEFVAQNLKIRLVTTTNWVNANCRSTPCTTGLMRENK